MVLSIGAAWADRHLVGVDLPAALPVAGDCLGPRVGS